MVMSLPSYTEHWMNGTVQKFPPQIARIPEIVCFLLRKHTPVWT